MSKSLKPLTAAVAISALIILDMSVTPTRADEPDQGARHLTIQSFKIYRRPVGADGRENHKLDFKARVGEVVEEDGGRLVAQGISIMADPTSSRPPWLRGGSYGELHNDDLVPVLGYVYRVKSMKQGHSGRFEYGHEVTFVWVPDSDLPRGLALGKDPVVVTLLGSNGVNKHALMATRIDSAHEKGSRPQAASAQLLITGPPPEEPRGKAGTGGTAKVTIGDVLLLGDLGYKVRNIVPKSDKTKAIGWVEFEPDSIKKANLDRDKVPYVVPEPVKASHPKEK